MVEDGDSESQGVQGGTRITDSFKLGRRDFLKATGGGALGTVGTTRAGAAQGTSGGEIIWSYETDDSILSSPTVVNGTVFIGSADERLYALDAASGGKRWEFDTGDFVRSAPNVVDQTVFVVNDTGDLYALDTSGNVEWESEVLFDTYVATATARTVFVGGSGRLYAVDADSGNKKWETFLESGPNASSPTVVDGTAFFGDADGNMYALDEDSGNIAWEVDTGGRNLSSPTVADETVFVGVFSRTDPNQNGVYALDAASGNKQWEFETAPSQFSQVRVSTPTVWDETVFVGRSDGNVYALDAVSGNKRWEFDTDKQVRSSPTVAGGTVFIGGGDGHVYALDAGSGEKIWGVDIEQPTLYSSPTVVDGTVFIGAQDYNVYAIDAGVDGRSEGSRVNLGTLGHHDAWANQRTLVVDETADEDDPEYQTIQAAVADAEEGNTIEVIEGTYQGPVLLDKTVTIETDEDAVVETGSTDDEVIPTPAAFVIDAEATPDVAPTLRGFTVDCSNCDLASAVQFTGVGGDWTVADLTIDGDLSVVIGAAQTEGDWTVSGIEVSPTASPERIIGAGEATGDWRVEDSDLTGSRPVDAELTSGEWRIEDCTVTGGDPFPAIDAKQATGDWHIDNTDIETGGTAIDAQESTGDWSVVGPGDIVGADVGIDANNAEGAWEIHRMNFLEMAGDDVFHILANDVTNPPGNARRNFFEDTDPLIGGTGDEVDVLVGNQLAAPASPDATGVSVTVINAIDGEDECDPEEPLCEPAGDGIAQPDATVYLFDTSAVSVGPDGDIRDDRADSLTDLLELLDGQELVFNDDVPAAATRTVETGPEGIVRYNGLDPDTEYCLLVTPPGESSGNVWSTCPTVEGGTVTEELVTLTDTTHLGYLRDDPFGTEVTNEWGKVLRDDSNTLRKTSEWLDRHRRERVELLREANREAELVEKPFETGEAGRNTLIEGGGKILDEILESGKDPKELASVPSFVKEVVEGVAIDWIIEKSQSHVAGWGTRRLQQVSEQRTDQFAERYDGYADELDRSWITKPHLNEPEGYDELETVVDAGDRIKTTPDDIDALRESNPPADLNHQHVRDVFRQFYNRVRDVALLYSLIDNSEQAPEPPTPPTSSPTADLNVDPGLGGLLSRTPGSPPDTLFIPDGTVYNALKSGEALPQLQNVANELRKPNPSDVLNDLFSAVSFVGKGLILLGVTAKAGVAVVVFAEAGDTATELVSEIRDAGLEWALAGFYMTLQLDTLHDIETLALAYEAHLDWLSDQFENPITGTVDGELTTTQPPITIPEDEDIVAGTFRATVENVGEETVPIRVLGYVLFEATRTYEDEFTGEEYTTTLPDNQSFETTEPDIGQNPEELSPGDQFDTDMRYVFQIPDDRPLSTSTFRYVTELYMGGKQVDKRAEPVEIGTDSQAVSTQTPASAADLAEVSARYTARELSSPVTKTDPNLDQYRTDTETLLDTRVDPGQAETVTATVPGDAAFAKVSLLAGSETAAELTVDAGGETVTAQNGSVALPTDLDEVALTVQASAVRSGPVPVTLSLITVPQRPAILGTIPSTLTGTPELGTTFVPKFELAEVGAQEPVEGLSLGSSALTNQAGTELPTELEVSTGSKSLPAGERQDVDITIDLPSSFDLSGEPTRFSGEVTVSSENAGELSVPVSVLLLDTPIESATLTDADVGVTAARVSPAEVSVVPPVPVGEVESVYGVEIDGEGEVSLSLPEPLTSEELDAVRVVDGEVESVTYVGGTESTTFTLSAGAYLLVIVEESGPPALPGQENPPQDLDGDGRYEDVNGDGEFTVADVQVFFQHRDSPEVQNNAELFNFAGDEPPDVTIGDVQALFDRLIN